MPHIIQFLHPSVEATPVRQSDSYIDWNNTENHRRKFIKSEGRFVNKFEQEEETTLTFWGEWEPQSTIERLSTSANRPKFLNTPYIDPTGDTMTHNTDPYVFGEKFRYMICQQKNYNNILKNLSPLSIILFGSCLDGAFILDTLFVISKISNKYSILNIKNLTENNNQFFYASVNPICGSAKYNRSVPDDVSCRISTDENFTYYEGAMFSEKLNYLNIYSFSPCKIYSSNGKYIFQQPKIELDFINSNQTQGINPHECKVGDIVSYWKQIEKQLLEQDLLKGTYFKTPPLKIK